MPFILRKIRKARWYGSDVLHWLPPNDVQADSLLDLSTKHNQLSVYIVENDRSNLDRILAALVGNCDFISNIDYALIPAAEVLDRIKIKTVEIKGETSDEQVNTAHRDLIELSASQILELAKSISATGERARLTAKKVAELIERSIDEGHIDQTRLKLSAPEIAKLRLAQPTNIELAAEGEEKGQMG